MTARSPSLSSSTTRSLGIASLLLILGAAIFSAPGCSDEPTTSECRAGAVDGSGCTRRVCQDGKFVDQPEEPDDKEPCTTDSCKDGQPQYVPSTGGLCNTGDDVGTCVNGECKLSCATTQDCEKKKPCKTGTCDTVTLTCDFVDDPASYDDKNDCTIDSCMDGVETHENAAAGTACGPTKMGTCDGNGSCGCDSHEMCPADEPCVDHFCDPATKVCAFTNKPDGDLNDDTAGDCKLPACSGGQVVTNPNDGDLPDDGNECTVDTCNAGVPANDPAAAETPCTTGVCDGISACVQCVTAANCMGDSSCSMNTCFACDDGTMNGTESDIDCGADCSTKCGDGKVCNMNGDCGSNVCDNNVCVSCGDGVKNGTESDIDCGGTTCPKCNTGQACDVGGDCVQGVCNVNKVCDPAKCNDTVKNGNETDVDCGGGTCPKCTAGKTCKVDGDCGGGTKCLAGVCG